jgi:signal transduction histidine kinase
MRLHAYPAGTTVQNVFRRAWPMTIRLRLTLWYTALLGATLILFSGAIYSALAQNLRGQFLFETGRQAAEISQAITDQIQGDLLVIRTDLKGIERLPPPINVDAFANNLPVQIINLNGDILKRSDTLKRTGLEVTNYTQALPNIRQNLAHWYYFPYNQDGAPALVYSVPLYIENKIIGAAQVIRSARHIEEMLVQMSRYLVLGTAFSLVLAAIVGAFLANRALTPIDAITQTASSITRTKDLEQRLNIMDNVSEVGQLAATFNVMLDRIQQLFKTQERLIADVSHELRTPLTTVQGNIELLQKMALTSPNHLQPSSYGVAFGVTLQETLREVANETNRMSKMINDLLLLAQADSGALQLQMAPIEMDTLLLEVYRQTKRIAEQRKTYKGWEIRLGSEDQASVWGDRERLRQLLINLTDNALKYTPEGGTITLSLENGDQWVKIEVKDTGMGIPVGQQEQIFERFYRTDKARSRELGGSGLGLSIVQWITQAHHGRITVTSKPQEGSTFTLWLPALSSDSIVMAQPHPV